MRKLLTLCITLIVSISISYSQEFTEGKIQKIDSLLNSIYSPQDPGGLIAISKNRKTVYSNAFGLANIELNVPNTDKSVIQIGSVTKQFTAISILQLYEAGKLKLSDPISKYLDDIPDAWEEIKIEQLLSHTSGIIDLFRIQEWMMKWTFEVSPQELISFAKDTNLLFEPGTQYNYSNTGYGILGIIIEEVSGLSYTEYLKQNIFDPLEMNSSYVVDDSKIIPNRANGYQVSTKGFLNTPYINASHYYAAGSIMSSAVDMLKWNNGLTQGKILNDSLVQLATSKFNLLDGTEIVSGFGFVIGKSYNTKVVEHGGSTVGTNTFDLWLPEDNLYVIVLNNSIAFPGGNVEEKYDARKTAYLLADILYDVYEERPEIVEISLNEFEKYQGVYHDSDGKFRRIYHSYGNFYWTNSKGKKFKIDYAGNDEFIFESKTKLNFKKDGDKIIEAILIIGDDKHYYTKTDLPLPEPKVRQTINDELFDRVTGKYNVGVIFKVDISKGENELIVDVTGQETSTFYLEEGLRFFKSDEEDITITFTEGKENEINGFSIDLIDNQMKAKKKK